MAGNLTTVSVNLSRMGFAHVTFAMMIQSNKLLKLQGIGQCLSGWLAGWSDDELNFEQAAQAVVLFEAMPERHARLWVALSHDDMIKLRNFRSLLEIRLGRTITLAAAIFAIIETFWLNSVQNTLA